jgi:hypothetical protein
LSLSTALSRIPAYIGDRHCRVAGQQRIQAKHSWHPIDERLEAKPEKAMTRYENQTPRTLFGVAAVALSALTFGLFAVLPAETGPSARVQAIASAAFPQGIAQRPASPADLRYIEPVEVVATRAAQLSSAKELAPAKGAAPADASI